MGQPPLLAVEKCNSSCSWDGSRLLSASLLLPSAAWDESRLPSAAWGESRLPSAALGGSGGSAVRERGEEKRGKKE